MIPTTAKTFKKRFIILKDIAYPVKTEITVNTRKTLFAPTIILANTDQIFDPVYLLAEFHIPVNTTISYAIAANIETTTNPNELDDIGNINNSHSRLLPTTKYSQ